MKKIAAVAGGHAAVAEDVLRRVVDTTPALIHTGRPDGCLDYFNKGWLDFLGKSLEEVCGWRWTDLIHPDDVAGILQKWHAALASGEPFEAEARVRRADGTYRTLLHRKAPLRDEHGNIVKWFGSSIDIEDRKRAEAAPPLEAQLRATLDTIPAYAWYALPSGALTFVNERTADYLGIPKNHPLRLGIHTGAGWDSHIPFLHPDDHEEARRNWSTRLRTGSAGEGSFRVRNAQGEYRWFLSRAEPLRGVDGTLLYWVGVNVDIEERKCAEEDLRRSKAYLSEAQRLSHTGSFGWDVSSGEIYWSEETFRIFELDPKTKITTDLIVQRTHPDDRQAAEQLLERASSERMEFALEHRLLMPDGYIKYLQVIGRPSTDEGRRSEFVGAVTDITNHRQAEESLRKSETYLADAQKLSRTGSWAWSPEVGIKYWSEECYRVQGFDPRNGLPRFEELFQRMHPDDQPKVKELIQRVVREKVEFETDYRLVDPGGAVRDIHSTGHPVFGPSGDLIELMGTVIDVTDRKRAEEEMRRSEAYLAEAQKLSHTGSFAWSLPDGIRYWSDECYRVLGFDPREGPPRIEEFFRRIHPDDQVEFEEVTQRTIREKLDVETEYRIVHPSGAVRDIRGTGHPVLSASGDLIELVGTVIDITERKQAEEEVRASEQKYRHLVDTTPAFVHTALPNGEVDFYNRGWVEYVGLPLTDLLGWGWTCIIHPEDLETVVPKWRAALEAGEPFVGESRVRRADGKYRWFLHREEPLRNEAEEIVKWYGSSIEIEERKIAEEKIREQETELRQILDLTPHHLYVFGPDGGLLYVNQFSLEYLGADFADLVAATRVNFIHPDDRQGYLAEREKGLLTGKPYEFELRLQRRDGTYRWFLGRGNPLKDEQGRITRWYNTATDIEDRKQAEDMLRHENAVLREELGKTSMFEEVIGTSLVLQMALARAAKVAPTESTVLILGETGTGKELIACSVHKRSTRSERPFISVNCAAIPASLIMSELFGHEKGAFTGALQRRQGRFELADGGTLFLDEIGDLPLETQIALLRVLQEREFERVGGSEVLRANVRVIAATNRDLQAAIADGAFRSDLYYRLNVFPITLPPLRERKEDIPLLVTYFVDRFAKRAGKEIKHIQKRALEVLQEYSWPGNVRELQNVIERSLIVSDTDEFSIDKSWVANESQSRTPTLDQTFNERKRIEVALAQSSGKVSGTNGAAAVLGMPASTLESKIRALRINKFQFKGS